MRETASATSQIQASIRQISLPALLGLSLIPGGIGPLGFVALYGRISNAGYPSIVALLAGVSITTLPAEVAILWLARRRSRASGEQFMPYREPLRTRRWLSSVPLLVLMAALATIVLGVVDVALARSVFSWLPSWYVMPVDIQKVHSYSAYVWEATLAGYMILNGAVGPIIEEFYFRGWLLPRMERFGRRAPLFNAVLFSLYHFWAPWGFFSRVGAVAPWVYQVRKSRNVYLGMLVHILLNTIGGIILIAEIMARL